MFLREIQADQTQGRHCDRCGVEVTLARVRRERMGHIELAVPVSHIWFYKCMPSRLGLMLDMSARQLERVIYYEDYIVVDPGQTPLQKTQLLNEVEFREAQEQYGEGFNAGMGAEAVKKLLAEIDLHKLNKELEQAMGNTKSKQIRKKLAKRLKPRAGLHLLARATGMDGSGSIAGDSAGLASARSAGRRTFCHERFE